MTELIFGTHNNWQIAFVVDGRSAIAGFFDSLDRPNLQGAIATARVKSHHGTRMMMQLPDDDEGFVETRGELLDVGTQAVVRVAGYVMQPKAWPLKLGDNEPGSRIEYHEAGTSIIDRAIKLYGVSTDNMRQDEDAAVDMLMQHAGTEALKDGANIIIEQTAALTSIDLNAGNMTGISNYIAAFGPAVTRALQVYNIGGAVAIDAGFMGGNARRGLAEKIEKELQADPLRPKLISVTKMGLIEIIRPRLGPSRMEVSV